MSLEYGCASFVIGIPILAVSNGAFVVIGTFKSYTHRFDGGKSFSVRGTPIANPDPNDSNQKGDNDGVYEVVSTTEVSAPPPNAGTYLTKIVTNPSPTTQGPGGTIDAAFDTPPQTPPTSPSNITVPTHSSVSIAFPTPGSP